MSDFLYDSVVIAPKTDFRATTVPVSKSYRAADWNAQKAWFESLRTGLLAGQWHGFDPRSTEELDDLSEAATYRVTVRDSDKHLVYWDGTTLRDLLSTGGHTIKNDAGALTTRAALHFLTADFNVTDDAGNNETDVQLATTGVSAATYTYATVQVDAKGRVVSASSGAAPVPTTRRIIAGAGISVTGGGGGGDQLTADLTISATGSGITAPLLLALDDATKNTELTVLTLRRTTSDAAHGAAGMGSRLDFELENDAGANKTAGRLSAVWEDASGGNEGSYLTVTLPASGVAGEYARFKSDGLFLRNGTSTTALGGTYIDDVLGAVHAASDVTAGGAFERFDSANTTGLDVLLIRRRTTHASHGAAGIGVQAAYQTENAAGTVLTAGEVGAFLSVATASSEKSYLRFRALNSGALGTAAYAWGSGRVGIGTGTTEPLTPLEVAADDASNNAIAILATLTHTTSGTAAAGIGAGMDFYTEDGSGNKQSTARLAGVLSVVTHGSEKGYMMLQAMDGSGSLADALYGWGTGRVGLNTGSTEPSGTLHVKTKSSPGASFVPLYVEKDQATGSSNIMAQLVRQGTAYLQVEFDGNNSTIFRQLSGTVFGLQFIGGGATGVGIQMTGAAGILTQYDIQGPTQTSNTFQNKFVSGAPTGLTRSEKSEFLIDLATTKTFSASGGASFTDQRAVRITAPVYAATTNALTITNASTFCVDGPPTTTGGNVTLTNVYSVLVSSGITRLVGVLQLDAVARYMSAGNFQTTVGAAGGGSALPATPTKYAKWTDDGGTTYVFPLYAAA